MKNIKLLGLLLVFALVFVACGEKNPEGTETSTDESTSTVSGNTENKAKPEAPKFKKVTNYKTGLDDTEGSILNENYYDENGFRVKFVSYDYYGSGEEESTTTYENDAEGNVVKMDDGNTLNTFEYANGNCIKDGWSRANGLGASREYSFDDKGNEIEEKNFTEKGEYDFSRVTEYTYDDNGNVTSEIKWEKYTDGSSDLQMFSMKYEFGENGKMSKKVSLREDGVEISTTEYKYDPAGNLIEEWEYEEGEVTSRMVTKVNEYGDAESDQTFNSESDESLQFTNTYKYDESGNMIDMMYKHTDGESWGERTEIEYY